MVKANLAALRKSKGLTQQQLAELSGISRNTIVELEAGAESVRLSTLEKVADALAVSVTDLLDEKTAPTEKREQKTQTVNLCMCDKVICQMEIPC